MSVLLLPIVPALLCCRHSLAASERGKKNTLSSCHVLTEFCVSRINGAVSQHLCTVEGLNLHVGCRKGDFLTKDSGSGLILTFFF